MEEKCETCRFFKSGYLCARYPPHPEHGWPELYASHWCGEYRKYDSPLNDDP